MIMYCEGQGGEFMAVQPPGTIFFLEGHGKSKMKLLRLKRWAKKEDVACYVKEKTSSGSTNCQEQSILLFIRILGCFEYSQNSHHWQQREKCIYTEIMHFSAVTGNLSSGMTEEEDTEFSPVWPEVTQHRTAELQTQTALQKKAVG